MRGVVLVLLALGACNQVFELDPTVSEPGFDTDGDGIEDIDDNCRVDINEDQADNDMDGFGNACDPCIDGPQSLSDVDQDGVDDACDPCLTGENSDEDTDGFLDGCDVCPAQFDPDQADGDGDGVGDLCDPSPTSQQHRVFFDGFARAIPGWNQGFIHWSIKNGTFGPDESSTQLFGPWTPRATIQGTAWQVSALVEMSAEPPDYGQQIGLIAYNHNGTPSFFCDMTFNGAQGWRLSGSLVTVTDNIDPIVVQGTAGASGGTCEHSGTSIAYQTTFPEPMMMGLASMPAARFRWVDVVQ
jgi:hypothetical protein